MFYTREAWKVLTTYCDSDYAANLKDWKSTSVYVFKMPNGLVAWSSKKHPVVSLSTIEVGFISAAGCAA